MNRLIKGLKKLGSWFNTALPFAFLIALLWAIIIGINLKPYSVLWLFGGILVLVAGIYMYWRMLAGLSRVFLMLGAEFFLIGQIGVVGGWINYFSALLVVIGLLGCWLVPYLDEKLSGYDELVHDEF